MSIAPGIAPQAVTITIATQARSGLASMLVESGPKPIAWPRRGTEFEKRNWNTYAMMIAETTIGITNTVRRAVWNLTFAVSASASRNAITFTRTTVTAAKPSVKP